MPLRILFSTSEAMMSFMAQTGNIPQDNYSLGVSPDCLPDITVADCGDRYVITACLRTLSEAEVSIRREGRALVVTGDDLSRGLDGDDEFPVFGALRHVIGLPDDADETQISARFFGGRLIFTIGRI
ncbi:MAG: Hsp20/alpha crystallin family protein [Rhodospirillaceae bacterium]